MSSRCINKSNITYVDGIYNETVFVDRNAIRDIRKSLKEVREFTLTNHAREQLSKSKTVKHLGRAIILDNELYRKIRTENHIVEYYIKNNEIYKYVIRVNLNEKLDMCLVITPVEDTNLILTVWTNNKDDMHKTTDIRKYIARNQYKMAKKC